MARRTQFPLVARLALACVFASVIGARPASAQWTDLPSRQPKMGVKHLVQIAIPWSTLGYGDGRRETFEGKIALYPPNENDERTFRCATDLELSDGDGNDVEVPETRIRLDKARDPIGAPEQFDGGIPREARYRAVADSDFALVPLRMLFRHDMPSGRGGAAQKESDSADYHVTWSERFLGIEVVSRTPLQKFESRVLRTHKASGWQILDYTLTFEDERDDTILGAFGVRLLIQPEQPLPDGRRAPGGVHHIARLKVLQLDWRQERRVIGDDEWEPRLEQWFSRLSDQLFFALDLEGVGDPHESPSAFAARALYVFDARSAARLCSAGSPKMLAAIAPLLSDSPLAYDPAPFHAALGVSADPLRRLLLATAAAAAGQRPDAYVRLARVGLCSRDAQVRDAACRLARALASADLVDPLAAALPQETVEDVWIQGMLALGTIGGPAASDAIGALASGSLSAARTAAACRALADLGEADVEPQLADGSACFGATNPDTGLFEVVIEDAAAAREALRTLRDLAAAARAGDKTRVFERLTDALRHENSDQPRRIALCDAAREWLVRMPALVPELSADLDDAARGRLARRIVAASGRGAIDELVTRLRAARSAEDKQRIALLLGHTKDPRARAFLMRMQESEDLEDFEVAAAGLSALEGGVR